MHRTISAVALACAALLLASPAVLAGTTGSESLRTLQASDLPDGIVPFAEPTVATTGNQVLVDGEACTQEIVPIPDLEQLVVAQFNADVADPGAAEVSVMSEAISTFATAKDAKASFKVRAAGARAALKCDGVDVLQEGETAPVATLDYQKLKFPKIGDQTYAVTVGPVGGSDATRSTTVAFRSGKDVVFINTFGREDGPTVKQLKTIARRAEKRLDEGS
jgi:hypothetical protein